ncbi:hypothetical protein GCM10027199_80360 [Amycolatopsis magusensis]
MPRAPDGERAVRIGQLEVSDTARRYPQPSLISRTAELTGECDASDRGSEGKAMAYDGRHDKGDDDSQTDHTGQGSDGHTTESGSDG